MSKEYYQKDLKKFWENREKARGKRDKDLARLTFSEKAAITEKLKIDYEVLQKAKEKPRLFGLGEMPPDAVNEISLEQSFTQEDFNEALDKVFPFTQAFQNEQGLS